MSAVTGHTTKICMYFYWGCLPQMFLAQLVGYFPILSIMTLLKSRQTAFTPCLEIHYTAS